MCICINCNYYSICWMKKGIRRLKINDQNKIFVIKNDKFINRFKLPRVNLDLHIFTKKFVEEFDVTNCENFCESPGKWIINELI
uniref:Ycf34 n=1 Tax=Eustigmatophyceae sp. Mont 10/10-1w TaxID=2506145 RepID=A0A410D227_9STRA|nr:hypothetical protein Ycf34 [Eustigmatophyceae sp. Mont 10/10-1w]QAA11774.1 hypothetical protein Ycf34 [Eustigmatophyceae sp. Mont 10/10-1w]